MYENAKVTIKNNHGWRKPDRIIKLISKESYGSLSDIALKRFELKLPGSSQELTALKHKKAKQQGLTFFFFAHSRRSVR